MKKTLIYLALITLSACSKSNNTGTTNPPPGIPADAVSYSGTLTIGTTIRHLVDYSVSNPDRTQAPYIINGGPVLSTSQVARAMDMSGSSPANPFFTVVLTDSRPDTLSTIQFNIPAFGNFALYGSIVNVSIGNLPAKTAGANITFTNVTVGSGDFDMEGGTLDSLVFSFKGSFKNMPH